MIYNPAVDIHRFQILAICGSLAYLLLIFYLIRSRRLREDYSLLWLFFGFLFLGMSFWRKSLDYLSTLLGVAYPPAAIFILLIMCLFLIVIQFSIIISKQANHIVKLAQEVALLKHNKDNASSNDNA